MRRQLGAEPPPGAKRAPERSPPRDAGPDQAATHPRATDRPHPADSPRALRRSSRWIRNKVCGSAAHPAGPAERRGRQQPNPRRSAAGAQRDARPAIVRPTRRASRSAFGPRATRPCKGAKALEQIVKEFYA